jgi:hypothetical protein
MRLKAIVLAGSMLASHYAYASEETRCRDDNVSTAKMCEKFWPSEPNLGTICAEISIQGEELCRIEDKLRELLELSRAAKPNGPKQ